MSGSRFAALAVLTLATFLIAASSGAQTPSPAAGSGFIHATVTWPSGESKTGFLRWDDEEAFWDDLFHCGYRDLVWSEYVELDELRKERRAEYFKTHGLLDRIAYALDGDDRNPVGWRMFLSRFGDLRAIEINDGEDDFAITADGARHEIGGFANDAGSRLYLYTGEEKPERIRWNDLTGIVFSPAPPEAVPYAERLYGSVETCEGIFEGFIQWDKSECTSLDVLDGEDEDGDVELEMGDIRSIRRARDNTAEVTLKDGTVRRLHGSNDVNSSNRGIMVEVKDLGRVTVRWNCFERITFIDGRGSGPGRETYANSGPLRGSVTGDEHRVLSGRLVFDLDEAWDWDIFNGEAASGLEYDIPFHHIVRIEPGLDGSCLVTVKSGRLLELGDNQDTGEENAGMLVFKTEVADPIHVNWSRVQAIELSR